MPNSETKAKVRPLQVRRGTQYACFGDGLCCTSIHGLGPLTKREVRKIAKIDPKATNWDASHEASMLRTAADGGCVFLRQDMKCSLHAQKGANAKPDGCRRFPFGLVATPHGGRITTEHRCPCRTLGTRPNLIAKHAEVSLLDRSGRLLANRRVEQIPLTRRKKIDFSQWEQIESRYLKQLLERGSLHKALNASPFPRLQGSSWQAQAEEFVDARDGTQFGVLLGWMGDAILKLQNQHKPRPPTRPWAAIFDQAEARATEPRSRRDVFSDWLCDEIWSLEWAERYCFEIARTELVTRLVIAEDISNRMIRSGLRADRAAAETLMIVETVGQSDYWLEVKDRIRVSS